MKPTAYAIRALLACVLLAATGASALAAPAARNRVARFDAEEAALQRRLATPEAARVFREYNAAHGQQIQQNLAVVYAHDPAYAADAGGAARPLGDSIVGPITLKWLTRFCSDYGIVATEPGFAQDVVVSLEQVAAIAKAHPDWQKILGSPDFDAWIDGQPTSERVQSLKIRRSGAAVQVNALIAQYLRERGGGPKAQPPRPLELTFSYDPKRVAKTEDLNRIAAHLLPLAKRPPEDEQLFEADVREALPGMTLADDTLALIKRYAQVDAYVVGPDLVLKLRREGMPEPAVTELRDRMGDVEFDSAQAFEDAFAVVTEASANREALERSKRAIVRGARVPRYQIPATLGADLAAGAVLAPPIADVFAYFRNVEYPNKTLFDKALEWQVRRALNMCHDPDRIEGMLTDAQFENLRAVLPEHAPMFAGIARLRQPRARCSTEDLVEADHLAYEAYLTISPRLDRNMDLQVLHAMPAASDRRDAWATPWCHCGRHARDGVVIGFYPLWTDGTGKRIDFGGLSRLDLYGLTVTDTGTLHGPPGMAGTTPPADVATLMREAHRQDVRVDWVIARSDWSAWSRANYDGKSKVLTALIANIVALLERPLPDGGQWADKIASLGADPGPTGGDGVALYFRHFPAGDKELYNEFVETLSKRLGAMRPARRVSVIVDYDRLGQPGAYEYRNLIDLIDRLNPIPKSMTFADSKTLLLADMPVLVMLPEPTQETKKALRGAVQEALRGTESARMVRAIVPVLEYDGTGAQQLADDIVYVGDNYFGIGFWPLPFAAADGTAPGGENSVNRLVQRYFQPNDGTPPAWHRALGALCPQRLWLRWAFWIALFTALGVGTYYFNCRGCNERLDNSGLYFAGMMGLLALPLVILLVLAVSDPLLDPYMYVLLALYGIGGLVVAGLVARYYFNKSRRKLP
jgi:hypothetical protein